MASELQAICVYLGAAIYLFNAARIVWIISSGLRVKGSAALQRRVNTHCQRCWLRAIGREEHFLLPLLAQCADVFEAVRYVHSIYVLNLSSRATEVVLDTS